VSQQFTNLIRRHTVENPPARIAILDEHSPWFDSSQPQLTLTLPKRFSKCRVLDTRFVRSANDGALHGPYGPYVFPRGVRQ
jgi:hypothetical protein